jgi:type I restriction enzyme S subunit
MPVKLGYKQTEVGVIPEEWEVKRLGDVATFHKGKGLPKSALSESGAAPCIHYGELFTRYPETIHEIFSRTDTSAGVFRSVANDVLMPTSDVTPRGLAKAICVRVDGVILGGDILVIRSDTHRVHGPYLSIVIRYEAAQVLQFVTGSTVYHLYGSDMKNFTFFMPPLPEQRAIATALNDVNGVLGALNMLIAKKRNLKQAAMQQLLTGKTRLPGFSGEWARITLGDIVEKIVGGGTPSRSNAAFWGNEIPWVTVKDFGTFNPRQSQESITELGLRNSASHLIPAGTLITSTRMALGQAVVYEVDVAINQDLKALFLKPNISTEYLTYWFENFENMIDELGSGSTVKGISLVQLRGLPFQAPNIHEQTAITSILSAIDVELTTLEARRDKTAQIKQGMMQELLTGRTRLVSPEVANA